MKRILSICLAIIVFHSFIEADIPQSYYDAVDKTSGRDAILAALTKTISSHKNVGYDGLYDEVFAVSDVDANGNIWDIYSNCSFSVSDKGGNYKNVCDCYNREHTVPQSWFGKNAIIKADAFHVYPTDGKVNGIRSNNPYGECKNGQCIDNECEKARGHIGTSTFEGYSGKVFEPDDEFKGDIARSYFYMVACYRSSSMTSGQGNVVFTYNNSKTDFTPYAINLFMKWHRQDPVSEKEKKRNDAIYGFQNNRNPFIDYPCLAEYIWGEYEGTEVNLSELVSPYDVQFQNSDFSGCAGNTTAPILFTPTNNATVQIGKANLNQTVSQNLTIRGANLTQDITLLIEGENSSYFTTSKRSLSAATVNQGTSIEINYTPSSNGQHAARLVLSSEEIGQRMLNIRGQCLSELASPSANDRITLYAADVKQVARRTILVKGTNLTDSVRLVVSENDNTPHFSVIPSALSAQEAMEGTNVQITYKPEGLEKRQATLRISNDGDDFAVESVTVEGLCEFDIDIIPTDNSALVTWNDAGVESYTVDVYKRVGEEISGDTLFVDECTSKDNISSSSGYVNCEQNGIKLGSSNQTGSITYSNINISEGAKVILTLTPYNKDANVKISVKIGENITIDTIISSGTNDYIFTANEPSSTISISSTSLSKRAFVRKVIIVSKSEIAEKEQLDNYPKTLSDTFQYKIENLLPSYTYYVTVSPIGYENFKVEKDFFIDGDEESPTDPTEATLLLPVNNSEIQFEKTFLNDSSYTTIFVKGVNLSNAITFTLLGRDSDCFYLPSKTFYASRANFGDNLIILYKPKTTGVHQAQVRISSDEVTSHTVRIQGQCIPKISLSPSDTVLTIVADSLNQFCYQSLFIKSIDIKHDVQIQIEQNEFSRFFSLRDLQLNAENINAGTYIFLSFIPNKTGEFHTQLILTSKEQEFDPIYLHVIGLCHDSDSIPPATNIDQIYYNKNGNTITLSQLNKGMAVTVYDSAGKQIKKEKITENNTTCPFTLRQGIYLIVVEEKKEKQTFKIAM